MVDELNYKTTLEQKFVNLSSPFTLFVDVQKTAGVILIFCLVLSLTLANNSHTADFFKKIIHIPISIQLANFNFFLIFKTLVNDFLMVFFFLILGLEIKREFVVGELKNLKRAKLVLLGAIGGSILPLIIYLLINYAFRVYLQGWAIPIATDTALVIGLISFFKKELPPGLLTFVTALAVIDDIIAVVIIAIFYTHQVNFLYLICASLCFAAMLIANFIGIRKTWFYALMGVGLWLCLEISAVHGAIAGIIVAFSVPARPKDSPHVLVKKMKKLLWMFEKKHKSSQHILKEKEEHEILEQVTEKSLQATTPLKRWKGSLQQPVLLFILPLFAFMNSFITIDSSLLEETVKSSMFWGILLGLGVGKPLGIYSFVKLGLYKKIGELPSGVEITDIIPVCLLAGVGCTMSIFITDMAFSSPQIIKMAKTSVILSSILVSILAILLLIFYFQKKDKKQSDMVTQ